MNRKRLELLHSFPIENLILVTEWFQKQPPETKSLLYRDNRALFRDRFGRQDLCINTSDGRLWTWICELDGHHFVLLTGASKGTCYEISIKPGSTWDGAMQEKYGRASIAFLESMVKVLSTVHAGGGDDQERED